MLLLGGDGGLKFDLGGGLMCSAEITSYRLSINRDQLETTAQGDEWQTYVAGLKGWSGDCNFNIRLANDGIRFTFAQVVPSIIAAEGTASVPAVFYLNSTGLDCPPSSRIVLASFQGVLLFSEMTLDISGAADLIRGATRFIGTGPLTFST